MALQRKRMMSPNYSGRGGSGVRLIVLHTAEGSRTIESLGSFFSNPSSGVSSHAGADDQPGIIGEYVDRGNKAWTAANANPYSVQIELCAFAAWSPAEWAAHPIMLDNTAKWIAEEAHAFNIPIVRTTDPNGRGGIMHVDLGAAGGGHWDCGPNFPMDDVIDMAAGGSTITEPPKPVEQGGAVTLRCTSTGKGYWVIGSDGGVFTYGDAKFHGSLGNEKLAAPVVDMAPTPDDRGYWMCGSDGGIFTFGNAGFFGSLGDVKLAEPINAIECTPTGKGYWMMGRDGGVFSFGDAKFYGAPTGLVQ
jgi:hypothetical protein